MAAGTPENDKKVRAAVGVNKDLLAVVNSFRKVSAATRRKKDGVGGRLGQILVTRRGRTGSERVQFDA